MKTVDEIKEEFMSLPKIEQDFMDETIDLAGRYRKKGLRPSDAIRLFKFHAEIGEIMKKDLEEVK